MAAPVHPLQPLKLPKGPSPTTPEQRYWRTFKTPQLIPSPNNNPITHISYPFTPSNPTSQNVTQDLFAVTTGARIHLYSTRTRKLVKTISRFGLADTARSAELRRDARVVCAGGDSGALQVFDANSRAILRTWREHRQPVWCARWSPRDNTTLMTGSDDGTVRLWDLAESNSSTAKFTGHADYVRSGCFMPGTGGANLLVSGSYDQTVRIWDRRTPGSKGAVMIFKHGDAVEDVLPLPSANGASLLTASASQLTVLDLIAAKPLHNLRAHQKAITTLCTASEGTRILSGALDGHVKVWDPQSWTTVAGSKYDSPVLSLSVVPSGAGDPSDRHLAVGLQSGVLSIKTRLAGTAKIQQKAREKEMAALVSGKIEEHDSKENRKKRKRSTQGMRTKLRGLDYDGAGADIVVEGEPRRRKKKIQPWDDALRKGSYAKALDLALGAKPPQPTVVHTLLAALHHRSALRAALEHRDDVTLLPVMKFLVKHIGDARYVVLTSRVAMLLLEMYAEHFGKSRDVDVLVERLHESVRRGVDVGQVAVGTGGMLELLGCG